MGKDGPVMRSQLLYEGSDVESFFKGEIPDEVLGRLEYLQAQGHVCFKLYFIPNGGWSTDDDGIYSINPA